MASMNKVFLMGNLTRDPELRYLPSGAAVCEFGLAVNRRYTLADGQTREETTFLDIVVWGKQAEHCNRNLKKGSGAFIEGRLKTEQWKDRETGQNRSRLRIEANNVQFLTFGSRESSGSGDFPSRRESGETQRNEYRGPSSSRGAAAGREHLQGGEGHAPHGRFQPDAADGDTIPDDRRNSGADGRLSEPPPMPDELYEGEPEDDIPF
jgi:single-strand DNA-binding protein